MKDPTCRDVQGHAGADRTTRRMFEGTDARRSNTSESTSTPQSKHRGIDARAKQHTVEETYAESNTRRSRPSQKDAINIGQR